MALINCQMFSHALSRNVAFNVILPTPTSGEKLDYGTVISDYGYDRGLPVLYLLHGMHGDCGSWIRYTSIERYAQRRRCMVVMASAGNEFFQDMPHGLAYRTFFTKELPFFVCTLFPASRRREDTFIAGLSMGGYGAWYLAMAEPDLYSKAASLSGAVDIVAIAKKPLQECEPSLFRWEDVFGDIDALEGGPSDLFAQYARCAARGCAPKLFQTCGTEDFLYDLNVSARDRMYALGADLTYTEGPGVHDWAFWDGHIEEVMDWMLADRQGPDKKC